MSKELPKYLRNLPPIGRVTRLDTKKGTKDKLGGCTFHNSVGDNLETIVWEITAPNLAVRICASCFKELSILIGK